MASLNEDEFLGNRKVRSEADKRVYILVAPRGLGSSENNYTSWSFSGSTSGIGKDGNNICDEEITPDFSYDSCNDKDIAKNSCSWTHCQLAGDSDVEDLGDVEFAVALVAEVASKLCVWIPTRSSPPVDRTAACSPGNWVSCHFCHTARGLSRYRFIIDFAPILKKVLNK